LSLFVARDTQRASAFIDALAFFAREIEVIRLPGWDCLPYDRIGPSPAMAAQRMAALSRLGRPAPDKTPRLLVTTVPGLLQRFHHTRRCWRPAIRPPWPGRERRRSGALFRGQWLCPRLDGVGAWRVRHPRGRDRCVAPGAEEPVRLDLFGDTLESIRAFDPETQRSTRQLTSVELLPVSEVLLDQTVSRASARVMSPGSGRRG